MSFDFDPNSPHGRLTRARTALLSGHEFIGALTMAMPIKLTPGLGTACTDGRTVQFDPQFVADLRDSELVFVLGHEVCHAMMLHVFRIDGRDPMRWNIAADICVNQLLEQERIGTRPPDAWYDPGLYDRGGGTVEGVYAILPPDAGKDQQQQQQGQGQDKGDGKGKGKGKSKDPGQDLRPSDIQGENDQLAREWKERVMEAALRANGSGNLGDAMKRLVKEILRSRVDWRVVLREFVVKRRDGDRTFSRPNRRFVSQGAYMPSRQSDSIGAVAVFVDCSGSVSSELLDMFAAEVKAIHADMRPDALHVGYFHHAVTHVDTFTPDDTVEMTPAGTGGTAFSPIFERIDEMGVSPVCCVVLTDLLCSDYGPAPDYPVLWVVVPSRVKPAAPPFGDVVHMEPR